VSRVREFYEANTWQFLLVGSGQAIHRELHGPGVRGRAQALDFAHRLVDEQLDAVGVRDGGRVLDLGCGVGAAMRYLGARSRADLVGVTISGRQVRIARRIAARSADAARLRFVEADFCDLPADLGTFGLAYSIEAFIHAPAADRYLSQAAAVLAPGGRLVIIDDLLAEGADADEPSVQTVRRCWHYDSLLTGSALIRLADRAEFDLVEDTDLSGYQNLGRPRDRLIAAGQPLLRRAAPHHRWSQMLVGGHALQDVLRRGLLQHHRLVFRRR
jgi:SAM-dependent methyltransferase